MPIPGKGTGTSKNGKCFHAFFRLGRWEYRQTWRSALPSSVCFIRFLVWSELGLVNGTMAQVYILLEFSLDLDARCIANGAKGGEFIGHLVLSLEWTHCGGPGSLSL